MTCKIMKKTIDGPAQKSPLRRAKRRSFHLGASVSAASSTMLSPTVEPLNREPA